MLTIGDPAPAFTAPDQEGKTHALADHRGSWVVLYFYPKDDTPGCTKEACGFRDKLAELKKQGIVVYGVSADSVESHKKFVEKFHLTFSLLADPDKSIIQSYDAWQSKILRVTYLIAPDGTIAKTYPKVSPEEHAEEILRDVASLSAKAGA